MAEYTRPKMVNLLFLLSLVFLFLDVNANTNANECSAGCKGGTDPKEGFLKGHTYTYSLEGFVNVLLTGADKQETGALISAQATVYALGNCTHLLKVTSVQFTGPDGKKYAGSEDFLKPVQFNMQDGAVSPRICAEENDSEKSLNIKRAILSLFQTATKRKTEVDVFGVCRTKFITIGNRVQKKKDLNLCKGNGQHGYDALYRLYSSDPLIKSASIMKGSLKSEIELKSGIVQSAITHEEYFYRPFSIGQSGAKAIAGSRLELKEISEGTLTANCIVPKPITFVISKTTGDENSLENIQNALKTATQYLDGHVQPKSASFFTALIRVLRGSKTDDIYKVYAKIINDSSYANKELAQKVYLDALFRCETGDSIEVTIKLIKDKHLNPLQTRLAFASLTSVRYASVGSLNAVTDLLDSPDLPNEVYLGAGALAAAHYREHVRSEYHHKNDAVIALSAKLVSKLGTCKSTTKSDENKIIFILKALKNIRNIEDNAVDILVNCASDKSVEQRVRVAALETLTSDPCIKELQTVAYKILEDTEEDSEMRIKAYLALIECPSKHLVKTLEDLLSSADTIDQVKSFITSSLINIQGSRSKALVKTRVIFGSFNYTNTYQRDGRKYSQAYQAVYDIQGSYIHPVIQSNIIYSQNCFVPRSVNLNLTASVFGKDINLIEFGARQDNLNLVLEEYFGPKGSFKSPQRMYDSWKETTDNIYEKIQKRWNTSGPKSKRDVQEQIAAMGKKLKKDIGEYKGNFDLDVFVKLFGSEAIFLSLGDDQHFSVETIIDRIFDYVEGGIYSAKKFSHEVRSHILFLDMELAYPTSSGMSLKLNAEGAATTKLTFGGDFDFRQFFGDIFNAKVDFQLQPSASVEIVGTLSVDADAFSTGLKVMTTLQTSTGVQITGKLLDGKGFDVKVGLPLERQEIITANNDVVFYTRERGHMDVDKVLKFNNPSYKPTPECYEKLAKTTGLTLCFEMVQPAKRSSGDLAPGEARFPLNGPASYIVYFEKAGIKSYNFRSLLTDQEKGITWDMSIDAEGAKLPTEFTAKIDVMNTEFTMSAILDSPIKRIEVLTVVTDSDSKCSISTNLLYGDDQTKGEIGYYIEKMGTRTTYTPIVDFVKSGYKGNIHHAVGVMHIDQPDNKIMLTFDGLGLVLGDNKVTLDGVSLMESTRFTWDVKGAGSEHTAVSTGKILFRNENGLSSEIDFQNSYKPQWNFWHKGSLKEKQVEEISSYDLEFSLVHGPDRESKLNLINYNLHFDTNGEYNNMNIKEKITYPVYGLESIEELVYIEYKKLLFSLNGKFMKHTLDFAVHSESNETEDTELTRLRGIYDGIGGEAYLKVDNKVENTTKYASYLLISPDRKYEVDVTMKGFEDAEKNNADLHFITAVTFPNKDLYTFDSMYYNEYKKMMKTKTTFAKGTVNYFEFNAKVDNNIVGDGKIFIKDIILFKADYGMKQKDSKLGVTMSVELYKFDRVYQLEVEMVNNMPKITGEWKLYTDYSKDKTKFYLLTTSNVLQDGKVDSKNLIIHGEEQTKLNFIVTKDLDKGFHSLDANIIDARENVYKIVYSQKDLIENELRNIDVQFRLENMDKDGASIIKIIWDTKVDDYNEESELGSAYTTLTMENKLGENMAYHLEAAAKQTDSKYEEEYKLEVNGTNLKENLSSHVRYEIDDGSIDYKLNLVLGSLASLALKGKFTFPDEEQKYKNYVNLLAHSQAEKFFFELDQIFGPKKIEESEYYTYSEIQSNSRFDIGMASHVFNIHLVNEDMEKTGKLFIQLPKLEPFIVELSNSQKFNNKGDKLHTSASLYSSMSDQKMSCNITGYSIYPLQMQGKYNVELLLPEKLGSKTVSTDFIYNLISKNDFKFDVTTECDSKKFNYAIIYEFDALDTLHADINVTYPDSETKRVYIKTEHLSRPEFNAQAIIQNYRDFDMDVAVVGKLKSVEDFKITMDVDCAKAAFNKVHFEAVNEPDDKQQHVKVIATEKGKSLLDGVITYTTKIENEMLFVIGTGKLTLRGKEETAKFQYSSKDKYEKITSFVGSIGANEFKVSQYSVPDNYNFITSYCKDKSDCANFDLKSKTLVVPGTKPTKYFEIGWDLRKFGFPSEFRLSAVAEYHHQLPMYSFTTHVTHDGHYYEIEQVMKTVEGRFETLSKITIPTREIHLTTSNSYFSKGHHFLHKPIYSEVIFYLNKNETKSKTHFKTNLDFSNYNHELINYDVELFFVYPGMTKEWQVLADCKYDKSTHQGTLNATFDVFNEKDQRVALIGSFGPKSISDYFIDYEAVLETDGKGLDIKYHGTGDLKVGTKEGIKLELYSLLGVGKENMDYKFLYTVNQGEQQLLVKYPAGNLLHYKNTYEMEGNAMPTGANWNTSLTLFNDLMYQTHGNIDWHDGLHATWKAGCEKTATMVKLSAAIIPGKKMEVSADYTATERNFPLLTIGYGIPSTKSLISTCKASKDGLRTFLDGLAINWKTLATKQYEFKEKNYEMEEKFDSALENMLLAAKLNLDSTYYHDQTVAILNEFKADSLLKIFEKPFELSMTIWFTFMEAVSDILSKTSEMYDAINKFWFSDKDAQRSSPVKGFDTLIEVASKLFDPLVDMTVQFVSIADTFIEKYAPLWNHIFTFVNDVYTTFDNLVNKLTDDVPKVYDGIKSAVKDSFPVRVMEGRIKFFTNENLEKYFKYVEEMYENILPENEWNQFKKKVLYFNDLDSHRNEKGFKEVKYTDVVRSANKVVVAAVKHILGQYGLSFNLHFDDFRKIMSPDIIINKKSFIKRQKHKTIDDVFENDVQMETPNNMILPNKLKACVAGGENFFTFDGNYYGFTGNCMYVLAHDVIDGNFTIAMEFEKGKPKSVHLSDKSGSWAQVDSHGKVIEGEGAPKVQVFKRGNMFIMKSSYGASVKCTYGLDICYFKVSGYYFGKLRGLLGDGNDEMLDDYKLPNGKIDYESNFTNSYAVSSECAPLVDTPETSEDTSDKPTNTDNITSTDTETDADTSTDTETSETEESVDSTDICSELFGEDSSFSDCYLHLNPYPYSIACSSAVTTAASEDEKSAACLIAKTYVIMAKAHKCKATLPNSCILCEVDGDTYDTNDASVTVNTPGNKADIVVVVEMTASNKETFENVVMPVMEVLLGELKTRKMDDVNVHLVGIKQDIPYPIFYDIEKPNMVGNKMTFDDEDRLGDYARTARYDLPFHTNNSRVDKFLQGSLNALNFVNLLLGYDDMFLAKWRLRELQLRPNATKTFILVHPIPCPSGLMPMLSNYYGQYFMKEEGAVAHLISHMPESTFGNHPDVVGFNDDEVYIIGEKSSPRWMFYYSHYECAKFSLGTYGNIYQTISFFKMDAKRKEKYIDIAAKTIADSITNYSYEKECSCELGFMDLFPQVTCETTSRVKITK